ncbi:DNA alkylation repair protein [Paucibacter aquatile]|uniref:DNA alkylation repair protein n=1 Tax=Kinneretia aquatilis TaxID=2070761 RepID=A0A2N8KZP3_9BURK|nr:DNA alkylation repair protein [Paucibacter aquatile]
MPPAKPQLRIVPPSPSRDSLPQRLEKTLACLRAEARPEQLAGMARFGLTGAKRLGLAVPTLRSLGKALGQDHALALALWDSGIPEAQILASLLAEPERLSAAEMDHWAQSMESWDVCDQACLNAFRRTPLAWGRIEVWAEDEAEFVKRAAFSLLAVLAVHDKACSDEAFSEQFPRIEAAAADPRNFVKKSVSWALRQIGKRNPVLRARALLIAKRLRERPEPSARWIGADAWRELIRSPDPSPAD